MLYIHETPGIKRGDVEDLLKQTDSHLNNAALFFILRNMKKNDSWLKSIYSDGSSNFVSNPTPKKGEKVKISLRVMESAPVQYVFFQGKFNGVGQPKKMEEEKSENALSYYSIEVQVFEDELKYFFLIATSYCIYYYTQHGITTFIPDEAYLFRILTNYDDPKWVKNAVFYQIFPDRFCNGNPANDVKSGEYYFDGYPAQKIENWETPPERYKEAHCLDFYGGDLEGIKQKIPYLKRLGITAVYLNPIFYAATVHKYDCLDYFHVDPHFGGDEAFAALTKALHENGIKIILDVSINHTGIAHRYFNRDGAFFPKSEGAFNNPDSEEREFYFFNSDNSYKSWFDIPTLPTLNYTSEKLREKLYRGKNSLVKKWLKEPYNIDGWRFDVGDVMARNDEIQLHHEVWPEIRASIKEENPEAYILAEDWSDCAEFQNGDEWDSPMNYIGSCRPIRQFYGEDDIFIGRCEELKSIPYKMTAKDFEGRITGYLSRLPFVIRQNQFNLIDSHDVPRFHNDKKITSENVRGALIILFTLPGCTNMYYGDEAEIEGFTDEIEGARFPMPWSKKIDECARYALYKRLIALKTGEAAFSDGGFKFVYTEGYIVSFARFTKNELYITVASREEEEKTVEIETGVFGESFTKAKKIEKDETGEEMDAEVKDGKLFVKVPSGKAYLIKV